MYQRRRCARVCACIFIGEVDYSGGRADIGLGGIFGTIKVFLKCYGWLLCRGLNFVSMGLGFSVCMCCVRLFEM